MDWKTDRAAARGRNAERYDREAAEDYDSFVGLGTLTAEMRLVLMSDMRDVVTFPQAADVLDVGAGTGAFCSVLAECSLGSITALEPSKAMLSLLESKAELAGVRPVLGFCDGVADRSLFDGSSFDVVASRKAVSSLFDPLVAFRHWHHWLRPGGQVVLIDGLFRRDSWQDAWAEEVDVLPLSAVESMATVPYLLESVGFRVEAVRPTHRWNQTARTPHYIVVASKA
jgi:ubiquinone/menaquinone biosynthesis C-methylase UbiE